MSHTTHHRSLHRCSTEQLRHRHEPASFAGRGATGLLGSKGRDIGIESMPDLRPLLALLRRVLVIVCLVLVCTSFATATELGESLSRSHAGLVDGDEGCESCHTDSMEVDGENCLVCHDAIAERIASKRGVHREVSAEDCAVCHQEHQGRDADIRAFDTSDFDHGSETGFPLEGSHRAVALDCAACHPGRSFLENSPNCSSCHVRAHENLLGDDCRSCHGGDGTASASRDFHKGALMPLEGRHLEVPCAECHLDGAIKGTPTNCYDCHWIRRQDDLYGTRLGSQCGECHSPISWTAVAWDHAAETGVSLNGPHRTVGCDSCHLGGRFDAAVPSGCYDCHRSAYERTDEPDHRAAGFPTTCEVCHSPADSSWEGASFTHPYELQGPHRSLDCASCHSGGVYAGTPTDCAGCHLSDYQQSENPDHQAAGFPTTCESCHRATDGSFEQGRYPHGAWPLIGAHTQPDCSSCHAGGSYQGLPAECVDCHLAEYQSTEDPDHQAAGFPTTCELCHSPADGSFAGGSFNHPYQLIGAHSSLDCADCHAGGVYAGTPSDCVGCHLADYQATEDPDHQAAGFPTACEACHSPADGSWEGAELNHPYALIGAHSTLDCADCHASGVYAGLPSDCVDCHLSDYQSTTEPDHAAAGFPTSCENCHSPADGTFGDGSFNHPYQLQGVHASLDCASCHAGGVYEGTPTDCAGCHLSDYQESENPDHQAAGFPTGCESCHMASDSSFEQGRFAHGSWPLIGAHIQPDCSSCHQSGTYQGLPAECVDCHLAEYQSTEEPDHQAAGFPTTCELCHSPADGSFEGGSFNHPYQLIGAHSSLDCADCHAGGVYAGTPSDCVGCHLADYQGTEDPDHQAAGFPTTCENCHSPADGSWDGAELDHPYPLIGAHSSLDCADCHAGGVYAGTPSDCVGCHLADYQGTEDPDHQAAGFPTTCEACHSPADGSWDGAELNHPYALIGAHSTLDCADCHASGVYAGLPSDCVDCHLADYQATTDPDHAAAGFPTTCENCHSPADGTFGDGNFNHPFQLQGVHASLECASCHAGGIYEGTPTDCAGCHLSDYQQSSNPDHQAAGFPTTCENCHRASDSSFAQGRYGHSAWPLIGAHTRPDCSSCHTGSVYSGLPSDCVDCHLADYQATTDPDHAAAGFPTTCENCHSPADGTFGDGNFNHPFQLVGAHAPLNCADCHAGGIYAGLPSDCVDCHLADYQATTDPDHAAAGFPTTCDSCHSPGDGGFFNSSFNHNSYFPISSGPHANRDCSDCHTDPASFAVFECTTACHSQGETSSDHSEVSGFVYNSNYCLSCHPQGQSRQVGSMRGSHGGA